RLRIQRNIVTSIPKNAIKLKLSGASTWECAIFQKLKKVWRNEPISGFIIIWYKIRFLMNLNQNYL
ncbi:hypothetical protein GCK32_014255, partial [Trichostrongylus colubriformis]